MDQKLDLLDFSFIIIVRLDSISRLENTLLTIEYLNKNLKTKISLLECAPYNNQIFERLLNKVVEYSFIIDVDYILHRTKYINMMVKKVNTKYIAVWDTDVLIKIKQIEMAANLLRNGVADFVYPYDNRFLDTSTILRKLYIKQKKIEFLESNASKMKLMYQPVPVGGAFFANITAYKSSGLENEQFYGWGLEDGERYYRWENQGYKILRVPGPLFHLTHDKGINSTFHNPDQHNIKRKELLSVKRNNI